MLDNGKFIIFVIATACANLPEQNPFPSFLLRPSLGDRLADGPFRLISMAIPDAEMASKIARNLVLKGLAATVNIFPSTYSVYIWEGTLRQVPEVIMIVFTHVNQYEDFERFIRENHVHIEPGLVSLPIVGGSASFLRWIENQSRTDHRDVITDSHMVEIAPDNRKGPNK